ncbi:solute carrier family 22 member 6-A-like [Mustelus asterias]
MSFADILEVVGGMGRFQFIYVLLLVFPVILTTSHHLLQNFVAVVPGHRCRIPPVANSSEGGLEAEEEKDFLRVFIPLDGKRRPEECQLYSTPQWHLLRGNGTPGNGSGYGTRACTDGWVFDHSKVKATIVSEWDLVCDRKPLKHMAQSIYMAGLMIGNILLGRLSDKYGRRTFLLLSTFLLAISGTCGAFSPSFPLFCLWRFLCGVAVSGVTVNTYSFATEWIPNQTRTFLMTFLNYSYTFGQLVLVGQAYAIQNWRWLQFAASVPYFIIFLYAWWIPESARWLILNDKEDMALKQLRRVAKLNGKEAEGQKLTTEILKSSMGKELSRSKDSYTILDLFRTPIIFKITCCTMLVWFATGFAYYGMAIDLQGFGVDIYLIQVIFGAVDVPAMLVGFFTMSYVGRRFTQATFLILAGSIMLANTFIPKELQVLRTSFAAWGKGCLAAAYTCCFLHTSELYPTVLRQTGLGLVGMMARIGSMMAPIVRLVGDFVPSLPLVIYGGIAILAGVAATFLPETLNAPLPDTIQEVESRSAEVPNSPPLGKGPIGTAAREKGGAKKVKEVTMDEIPLEETQTSLIRQNV